MSLNDITRQQIDTLVKSNQVVLFMKGTPQQPLCGFSARTVAALDAVCPDYASFNVLDDEAIREGIKEYGSWPTIPQLYVNGELVGGCDIVLSMVNSGELHRQLGLEPPDRTPPEIKLSDAAAEKIREAMQGYEGMALQLQIDANWSSQFNLTPDKGDQICTEANGIKILMDIATAQRARGAAIDWVKGLSGEGLSLNLPQAPPAVKQMTVQELSQRLADNSVILIDIRNEEERGRASLKQAQVLDPALMDRLAEMPRDTGLAFICHHGNSSMGAAEHFRQQGFTSVHNVSGGMDAWSQQIDPAIPRY